MPTLCIHFFIVDTTRRKKVLQNVRPSSKVLLMTKKISTADLATKTCKRGHTGHYFLRRDGSSACKVCTRGSIAKYRGVEEVKLARLRESSLERLAELTTAIPKLKLELELSQTEHEFLSKQLAILSAK